MDQRSGLLERSAAILRLSGAQALYHVATRYVDILIAPWVLEERVLYAYLVARILSFCIPIALTALGKKAGPQLVSLAAAERQIPFQAAAARVNLGYLMVCGAMALLVMSGAHQLAHSLGVSSPEFGEILVWMVIGHSAPVLFGATALLMHAVDRGSFYELLSGVTALLFLAGVVVLGAEGGVMMAQTFAAAQLTQAALCALLLTQCGVWPGLTAVFHKQIRLF